MTMSDTNGMKFSTRDVMSDVVLVVEGRQLHVNKTVLAIASPVFQTMFFGEFKEKNLDQVPLPGKKYAEFHDFLVCICPGTSSTVTWNNIDSLLALADEYSVESLKEQCRSFALGHLKTVGKDISKDDVLHFLQLADRYNFADVQEECLIKLVYREYGDRKGLNRSETFNQLSESTQIEFFRRRLEMVEELVRSVLKTTFTESGAVVEDFDIILEGTCSFRTHRSTRHECRFCRAQCCERCRNISRRAMEGLTDAMKKMLPAFKESETK